MRNAVVYAVHTLLLVWMSGAASADLDRVAADIEAGSFASALDALEGETDSHRARLLRANALAGVGRSSEAEKLYRALIKEQPRDPSAYNNLATLYASAGRLQEASELLEQAMKSDARFATVHRNLSRIYVEMSSKAYARALRLNGGQQGVTLLSLDHRDSALYLQPQQVALADAMPKVVPAAATRTPPSNDSGATQPEPAEKPAPRRPAPVAQPSEARAVPVSETVEARPLLPVAKAAPVERIESVARVAPVETIATAAPTTTPGQGAGDGRIVGNRKEPAFDAGGAIAALQRWASRWSAQDVAGYLDSYDRNFQPANGVSREQWRSQRERRLRKPGSIKVRLSDYEVATTDKGGLLVKALQYYRSDNYSDSSRKGFVLVDTAGGWKIREEFTIEVLN